MTIAVAVRTGSAVVFAADSKVTTRGVAGISSEDGSPLWLDQTYDNATKVGHDQRRRLMVMAAGHANIGLMQALDFIAMREMAPAASEEEQEGGIKTLVEEMVEVKRAFWSQVEMDPAEWPGPTLMLASHCRPQEAPRVWQADLTGEGYSIEPVLQNPGILLDGSYREVFSLLYGWRSDLVMGMGEALGLDDQKMLEAMDKTKILGPIQQINCASMPLQDAVDLAVFLCTVQVEMDRFLPGTAACGGPIDVLVFRAVPTSEILSYPGKELHHPHNRG